MQEPNLEARSDELALANETIARLTNQHDDLKRQCEALTIQVAALRAEPSALNLAWFAEGESDLRWAKEQAVTVAQGSALLSGAFVTVDQLLRVSGGWVLIPLLFQALFASYWEWELHQFAKDVRARVRTFLEGAGAISKGNAPSNHRSLLFAMWAVILTAAGFAAAVTLKRWNIIG